MSTRVTSDNAEQTSIAFSSSAASGRFVVRVGPRDDLELDPPAEQLEAVTLADDELRAGILGSNHDFSVAPRHVMLRARCHASCCS